MSAKSRIGCTAVNPVMKRGYQRQHYLAKSPHRRIKGYSKTASWEVRSRDGVCAVSNHLDKKGERKGNGLGTRDGTAEKMYVQY